MNKTELIEKVHEAIGGTKADASAAVNATLEAVRASLASGEEVAIIGLGKIAVVEHKARTGRNPATGEEVQIPAKKAFKFKAGQQLLDELNA